MGFFNELTDFVEYMMFGERSTTAARMRANRAELDRQNREAFERERAAKQNKPQSSGRKPVQRSDGSGPRRRVPRGSASRSGSWEKYSSSTDNDTGRAQTDFFSGTVGETDQKRKVHVAIDEYGNVIFVRDMDGTVLYNKKNGIGYLPPDLDWSRD